MKKGIQVSFKSKIEMIDVSKLKVNSKNPRLIKRKDYQPPVSNERISQDYNVF
jgi:hypothetical protein